MFCSLARKYNDVRADRDQWYGGRRYRRIGHRCYSKGEGDHERYSNRFRWSLHHQSERECHSGYLVHRLPDTRGTCETRYEGNYERRQRTSEGGCGNRLYHPAQGRSDGCHLDRKRRRDCQAEREQPNEGTAGSCTRHEYHSRW